MTTLIAAWMFGCSGEAPPPPKPEPAPAPAPEPEPAPEPKGPEAMDVDAANAGHEANVGKEIAVRGFYSNMTKQENPTQINVPVYMDAEMKGGQVLCVMTDMAQEAGLAGMTQGAELTVKGTVAKEKFFANIKLEGCVLAPSEGGEGKAGKGKAKADDGAAGGDEGKAGKGKAGKGDH